MRNTLQPALSEVALAVTPVLAVHTAAVPGRHLQHDGVHVVDAMRSLLPLVRGRPLVLGPGQVSSAAERALAVAG